MITRLQRLLRLITILQGGRCGSTDELSAELGVARRTVFRDVGTLRKAGIAVTIDRLGCRIPREHFLPPAKLTVPEVLGLLLLSKKAATQRGRPLMAPAQAAIDKLFSQLPAATRSACLAVMKHISVSPYGEAIGAHEAEHFTALQRCIDECRIVKLRYQKLGDGEAASVRFKPLALHFAARAWYVLGLNDRHGEVRVYKLTRIHRLELTPQLFTRPRSFSAQDKLGKAWQLNPDGHVHRVELVFSPKVAVNVCEVQWHATQQTETLPDGSCKMTFTVDGLGEIAWWICGYADQVTILKPPELRKKVREMLSRAVERHAE